jgi:hypothetical protein
MARRGTVPFLVLTGLLALALLGGGGFLLFTQQNGTPAKATVTECSQGRRSVVCTGTWVAGGDLAGGDGRVVRGTIDGASSADLGTTIDVRLAGERAYTTSRRLPVILLCCGVAVVVGAAFELRKDRRRRGARPPVQPPRR